MKRLHLGQMTPELLHQPMRDDIARQHGTEEGGSHVGLPPTGPRIKNNGPDTSNPNSETILNYIVHLNATFTNRMYH